MSRETFGQRGQRGSERVKAAAWGELAGTGVVFGLDEVDDAAPAEIGVAEEERFLRGRAVRAVEAPVADEQVGQAVAVEVASGDAGPEAGEVVERGARSVERGRWGVERRASSV